MKNNKRKKRTQRQSGTLCLTLFLASLLLALGFSIYMGINAVKAHLLAELSTRETVEAVELAADAPILTNLTEQSTVEQPTEAPAPFYELSDHERALIEQVVAAEARGEPYEGQKAVAQCILDACLKDGIRPAEAIRRYSYAIPSDDVTQSVKSAVAEVFDSGIMAVDEPILYFYAPSLCYSSFHESQIFVIEIGHHRFFKEA